MSMSKVASVLGLSPGEVVNLTSILRGTLSDLGETFNLNVTESEWNSVAQIREAVAYQGFDPMKILEEFHKRALAHPLTAGEKAEPVTVGDSTFYIYGNCEPKSDLLFLITLFLTRGNNVAKILLKCDAKVKATIERKCGQYGVSTLNRTPGAVLGPNVMTLARIAQAFSPATAAIIMGHNIIGNLKSKLFTGVTLPLLMTHTIFSGLLRECDVQLIEIAKFLNLEMTIMLSAPKEKRRMENQTLGDLYERSELFVNAAASGSLISDVIKQKVLIKAGILTDKDEPSTTSLAMSSLCGVLSSMKGESYATAVKRMASHMKQLKDEESKQLAARGGKEGPNA